MPPKGRTDHEEGLLEYLEDIIGTASYKPEIETAAGEVERLGEERQVVMNRVKLVEKEKGALEVCSLSSSPFPLLQPLSFILLLVLTPSFSPRRTAKSRQTPTSATKCTSSRPDLASTNATHTKLVPTRRCMSSSWRWRGRSMRGRWRGRRAIGRGMRRG